MNGEAHSSHKIDLEHPWLGLESFSESTRGYFFGRDAEVAELLQRLRLHPLLVVFGRSGLGKTSLLRARLIPELEKFGHRPAIYRIRYREGEDTPIEQLLVALEASTRLDVPGIKLPEDSASRLWLHFHHREGKNRLTHLILDQFEEVFTIGSDRPDAELQVRQALAILTQGAIPPAVEALFDESEVFVKHFHIDVPPLTVVLSVRQDYFFALNRWRQYLPQICQNNFELRALRGPAAFDAVFKPGELRCHYRGEIGEKNRIDTGLPPIVSHDTAERIVRFIAKKGDDIPIEEIEAVPPILSLLCYELNERRFTKPAGTPETPARQISFREGETDVEAIISTFYERCLAGRPEAVRIFIEEELISPYSGARRQQDKRSILMVFEKGCEVRGADRRHAMGFGNRIAARSCLDELVDLRLLSALGGDNLTYELTHDLLATVAQRSRAIREAGRRADAEKTAKEDAELQARRAQRMVITVSVALVVAVVAAVAGFVQYGRAEAAKKRATRARQSAERVIEFMTTDLRDKLQPIGKLNLLDDVNRSVQAYYNSFAGEDESPEVLRRRSVVFNNVGDVQNAQGDLTAALKSYRDSLAIREKLAKQDPGNAGWQRDLSVSYDKVGDVQRDQGDLTAALKSYRDSLAIREKLAKQDPGNAGWQRDLSVSYDNVGDVQRAQGDLTAALKSYRDSLAIREKLAKQDPGNAGWQHDLSVSYNRVGNVQRDQGDLTAALKSYRDSLAIDEKLAKQDPGNARWQRDLSVSYDKVGDVQNAQGDLTAALKSCRDSLAICEKLAKQDPGNAGWQRDLSVSYDNVGNVQKAQGDLTAALKSYRDSLAIDEKLAKQHPGNAGWQRDLALSHWKTGTVVARVEPKSRKEAQAMLEKARDILRQLNEGAGLTAQQQKWLISIEADLREMGKE